MYLKTAINKTKMSPKEMVENSIDFRAAKPQFDVADWKKTYLEYFVVEGELLTDETGLITYRPRQVEIIAYFRLHEKNKPEEDVVVYLIETVDGRKGILLYKYDVFTDCKVYAFLKKYADYKFRLYKVNPQIQSSNSLITNSYC